MKTPLLEMKHVHKSFGHINAVNGISVTVHPGEIVALLGSNGAGKTTFISLASGTLEPTAGEIKVFGKHPCDPIAKQNRRVLPQELDFPRTLTVNEILKIVYAHYPHSQYEEILRRVHLDHLRHRRTGELSGGERRKLAIICSLAGNPSLVILDEPTANIDLEGQANIHILLKEYFSSHNASLMFSSHHIKEVEEIATRVIVISIGKIVFDGPIQKLKKLRPEKKIRFRSQLKPVHLHSAIEIRDGSQGFIECLGFDSDEMLREIINNKSFQASQFEILEPSLDEAILSLCKMSSTEVQP